MEDSAHPVILDPASLNLLLSLTGRNHAIDKEGKHAVVIMKIVVFSVFKTSFIYITKYEHFPTVKFFKNVISKGFLHIPTYG